jgi:hypothetical protein
MSTRSSGLPRRMLVHAVLVLAAVAISLTAFAGSASAHFILNTGTLKLENGSSSGTPPSGGSWVRLPSDNPTTTPFNYFPNPTTTAASTEYTLIDGTGAGASLALGRAQPSGGIFGPLTTFNGVPFSAITIAGSAPTLTFDGADDAAGTRTLTRGDLTGLRITYNGALYNVGTNETAGGTHIAPLHGSITGNATSTTVPARIQLDWTSDLTEPGFSPYQAQFHWTGTYTHTP